MRDLLISSSVLILSILLIRHLVKEKISPLLQYMLWLPIVLRLMLPFPLWDSSVSVMNLFPEKGVIEYLQEVNEENRSQMLQQDNQAEDLELDIQQANGYVAETNEQVYEQMPNITDNPIKTRQQVRHKMTGYLLLIWLAGVVVAGGYMLFYQIKWKKYLRKNRKKLITGNPYSKILKVYTVEGLPSPCLSGRNVYLTQEMAEKERQLTHILAHEYCHYRHLDYLWVIVRCCLIAVYWFHPLVWAAAYASKQDSELACDEAAIRLLGEEERFAYGRTLVGLITGYSSERSKMGIASTMSGGEKGIRQRVGRIANKSKRIYIVAGGVLLVTMALVAVTFTAADRKTQKIDEVPDLSENPGKYESRDEVSEVEAVILSDREKELQETEQYMKEMEYSLLEKEEQLLETQQQIQEMEQRLQEQLLEAQQLGDADEGALMYSNPCPSYTRVSDGYGSRTHPVTGETILHNGVDLVAEEGADIVAAQAGEVYQTGFDAKDGNYVVLYHQINGAYTYYTACKEILVKEGEWVEQGQKIAEVGKTGASTGSHLHFGVMENGEFVEPVFLELEQSTTSG
ncbi:hypothetical protein C819_03670 [Lachnospiraceae bacterium 10-1]|nr:hypothetical protein C819_03670 [Lachnospiraceae bacterium 10-1]